MNTGRSKRTRTPMGASNLSQTLSGTSTAPTVMSSTSTIGMGKTGYLVPLPPQEVTKVGGCALALRRRFSLLWRPAGLQDFSGRTHAPVDLPCMGSMSSGGLWGRRGGACTALGCPQQRLALV
jgi:hypothetical protein